MKTVNLKNGIIAGLLFIVLCLSLFTCHQQRPQTADNPFSPSDTVLLHYIKKEKINKEILIKELESNISKLQTVNKNLASEVYSSKNLLKNFRTKEFLIKHQLNLSIQNFAKKDSSINDSIVPLIKQLSEIRDSTNRECDTTIAKLEQQVYNKDSVIELQRKVELELRDFSKEQALQNEYLTAQLNTAYKQQKRKTRQNKLLAGGLLILSGITTSILLIHSQR